MCIEKGYVQAVKNGQLILWKIIRPDNRIGIWRETYNRSNSVFRLGVNIAKGFSDGVAQFHCFFTRKAARKYTEYREEGGYFRSKQSTKTIKVYVNSEDVVSVGLDQESRILAISVSKMTIKSLKHQR